MSSLLLNNNWDLCVDVNGNLMQTASSSYATEQDVACVLQTYLGEVDWDTTVGVPYTQQILGQAYAPTVLQALIAQAATTVPTVVQAKATVTNINQTSGLPGRLVSGSIRVLDTTGQELGVNF